MNKPIFLFAVAFGLACCAAEPVVYEAELAQRATVALAQPMQVADNPAASGGKYVRFFGGHPENTLVWENVKAEADGEYTFAFDYFSCNDRFAYLQIDGGERDLLETPASPDAQTKPATAAVTVKLAKGAHTVRLSNPGAWGADFDRLRVSFVRACSPEEIAAARFAANPVPALGQNAQDQKAYDPAKKGPRILFVGNSITLHGPAPKIGWHGNWGMAASWREKDYVHLLQKKIKAVAPDAQCCLLQVADTFERSFFKPDWTCEKYFQWAREFRPDVVLLFFGANVPGDYDAGRIQPARSFGEALDQFCTYLAPDGHAKFLFCEGFYARPKLDGEKAAVAQKRGDVYVKMDGIRGRADAHGAWNHPGDLGMELIANRFWESLAPQLKATVSK